MLLQNAKRVLFVLAAAGLASGCADYMNHRDSITFGLGNAMEANKAIHTEDPFPPEAQRTWIASDGKVIRRVVTQYQNGGAGVIQPSSAMGANGASSGATASQ
ncbi:hypothetical protein ACCS91_01130 [Rhizobium ruizarguesonis]|uniref:hypothetical protein n=1 Tax=Rhizobium ruizarguesonis TaxID=2081791 RepID=UPI001030BD98|nr:hypothetical protein [Rhizobium ruizarguesonis]NEK10266.1 hypothetical protein [Rhizobium ruizarguesonis]TAW69131.1 hypothetical protein ELI10_27265 [Rhizobium ruizarguesonis]TAX05303.1 hypothetical protein ELI09_28510 [Rhizobium ruizarguesonis]TAX07877.1 hypothetical protein ELI08_28530 [Rhizobium ruizarguesonis]WSH24516.1 hypothetical protein U8Q07_29940 [Rhizobium ruizarguesonis]